MANTPTLPIKLMVLIALLQGLALLLLHQSFEIKSWPSDAPQWFYPLYTVALISPVMLLLSVNQQSIVSVVTWVTGFSALLFVIGYYAGLQATPAGYFKTGTLVPIYLITIAVATFKALMYIQHFATGKALSYQRLFLFSWRNFLTLALSLLFTLCFWGVLMLWAQLFKAININFFLELFIERWFLYPALSLAHGCGVILFRQQAGVIDTITRIQQSLMKFLLVILVFVSISFLLALPFTGLQPLWDSGGSTLILWMQALILFFVNAVYQDDPAVKPYNKTLHRFIFCGLALLPVYSLLSFYGLSIRVEQYGWSLSRCWAFLIWGIFALFSLGYLWGIIRLRDNWLQQLSWVNVRMGLVVLALMVLVNSPLLDFKKITVASQLARLDRGELNYETFDYRYFHRQLARPGYQALQQIKQRAEKTSPATVLRINSLYSPVNGQPSKTSQDQLIAAINTIDATIPQSLETPIYQLLSKNNWRMKNNEAYHLVAIDMNKDDALDYILIEQRGHYNHLTLFYLRDEQWQHVPLKPVASNQKLAKKLPDLLLQPGATSRAPEWQQLVIGEFVFQVQ